MDEGTNVEEEKLVDPGQRHKNTICPRNRLNRVLITEVLLLAKCHEVWNDTNTVVDKNVFWRALDHTQLEVHKKHPRNGDGSVTDDATHEFIMVKVTSMIPSKSKTGKAGDKSAHSVNENAEDSDNAVSDADDEESMVDLEEAIKAQDGEGSVGDRSYFSDDDVAVIDVEHEDFVEGNNTPVVTIEDDNNPLDDDEDQDIEEEENEVQESPIQELEETQVEDFLLDEANDDEGEDDEEERDVDDEDAEDNAGEEKEVQEDANDNGADNKAKKKEGTTIEEGKLREKKNVKGMKVVELNVLATKDVVSVALEKMGEKNVIAGKQWDAARKEREHHFLRYKLFCRLEEMEQEGAGLGLTIRREEGAAIASRLDRSQNVLKRYKASKTMKN